MKVLRAILFLFLISITTIKLSAQSDSSIASHRALIYADSLLNAFRYNNWNQYIEMSYPGIIQYYGGKKNFREYVQRSRIISSISEEAIEKTEVVQIKKDAKEWQCVIKKTSQTLIDGKRAYIISYLVGQSKDEGQNWKYVDIAFNSVENVIYIMPDIFDSLTIPQRQVIFEKNQVASKQ